MHRRRFNGALLKVGGAMLVPSALAACASTSSAAARITGIDTHAHVFHRGLPFEANRRYTPDYDARPEQFLARQDASGLSHGVIVPISILGTNNDYTLECIAGTGGRLRGLAVVDPATDIPKLEGLARGGIVGVRLNLIGKPVPDVRSGSGRDLVEACRRLDWQVEVYDDAQRLSQSVPHLLDAGVNVVVDHFGKPDPKLGLEDPGFRYLLGLGPTRKVWVKLSAPYRSSNETAAAAAPLLLKSFGPERLMWASDWPHTGFESKVDYATLRAQLNGWVPDAEERRLVLVDTPARLFKFVA